MVTLLTGVLGFICSNLCCFLVKKYPDKQFLGIDKVSYCSSIKNIEEIMNLPNFFVEKIDITDKEKLILLFEKYNITEVLHLAAYTHVDMSFGNSIEFTQNNVLGTHILLEISRNFKVEKFIHMSTDEVYGSKENISTENTILDPTNPYAASKASAEHIVMSYYHSFKFPVVIVRGNNVYGPKQYPEKVIPKFIYHILDGQKCPIQGSGEQTRNFIYVDDMISALEIIFIKGEIGQIYNIGSDDECSINEIAKKILSSKHFTSTSGTIATKDRNFNDQRYRITSDKMKKLGWKKTVSLDDGINQTIKWYIENQKDYRINSNSINIENSFEKQDMK